MRFLDFFSAVEEKCRIDDGVFVGYWTVKFRHNVLCRSLRHFLVLPSQDACLLFAGICIEACRTRVLVISLQSVPSK